MEATVFDFFAGFVPAIAMYLGIFVLAFVMQIMCGVAIYRDAKALGRDDAVLFGVLTGFFGGIPAAVYLAVRGKRSVVGTCPNCSMQYGNIEITGQYAVMCSNCGAQLALQERQPTDEMLQAADKSHRTNKALRTLAIIAYILMPLLAAGFMYFYMNLMTLAM